MLIRKRTRPRRVFAGIVSMVFVLLLAVGQCSAASAEASSDTPVPSKWGYENFRDYMPDLRNQGKYGACWAVSAIALAEINLGRQGKIIKPNLSEVQLAYFFITGRQTRWEARKEMPTGEISARARIISRPGAI